MKTGLKFVSVEIAQPLTEIPVAPEPPPPPKPKAVAPKPELKPIPVEPIKLNPTQPHIFANLAKPKPVEPKVEKVDVKALEVAPTFEAAKIDVKENGPKRPKEDVKVGNLGRGAPAPATVVAPVNKVQTGGFGDPNGLPGKGDPNKAGNVNRLGSPALPVGEGYGNGTGGKEGIRGTVASTGFGNGTAIPPRWKGKKGNGSCRRIQRCRSADRRSAKEKVGSRRTGGYTPNILDKPRPIHREGRSLKLKATS